MTPPVRTQPVAVRDAPSAMHPCVMPPRLWVKLGLIQEEKERGVSRQIDWRKLKFLLSGSEGEEGDFDHVSVLFHHI